MSDARGPDVRGVVIPFIIFTLIWGSTWIVIRGQIGTVAPQWSVAYRFIIAAIAMAGVARWRGEPMGIGRDHLGAILFIGCTQFGVNFSAVYVAELFITSGVVATMFALLLIPSSLLAWAILGQRPDRRFLAGSVVAIAGIGLLLSHEIRSGGASLRNIAIGTGFTLLGMLGAAAANVFQARPQIRHLPLFALLAWSMAAGATINLVVAAVVAGPPTFDLSPAYWLGLLYLALAASVLTFSLYYPVIRRIGPARAAYSSMLVPIIAMGFSTFFEHYRWTATTIAGAALAIGGMAIAMSSHRRRFVPPDAA